MASNNSSFWNIEILNNLDNFNENDMPDIREMMDEELTEIQEVIKHVNINISFTFTYYRPC